MYIIYYPYKSSIDYKCGAFAINEDANRLIIYDATDKKNNQPTTTIVFDKNNKRISITSSTFGNGKNLFLTKDIEKICISDSLRELKNISGRTYKLNEGMLPHFLYNGFVAGSHTLVEGVYKLPAVSEAVIDKNGITIGKSEAFLNLQRISLLKAVDGPDEYIQNRYFESLEQSVNDAVSVIETDNHGETTSEIALALSAGYDSNCILYNINKLKPDAHINAFSVGGISGVDETYTAGKIAEYYSNVKFNTSYVSPETLTHFDEIVEILEGSVYERGIFLQYELAKLLKLKKVKYMICGECADQVFHEKTYEDISDDTFLFGYQDTPYQMAEYVVLRKNRMMLEHFGIIPRYPFLTKEMIEVGAITRKINGTTKEFHKAMCRKSIPDNITDLIGKQGGSADLGALFEDGFDCEKELINCKFYSPNFRITGKYSYDEAVRDYYLTLKYIESFESQFCD